MLTLYSYTKFHMLISGDSLVISVRPKAKYRFSWEAIFLF
jgi:hypothetical protein